MRGGVNFDLWGGRWEGHALMSAPCNLQVLTRVWYNSYLRCLAVATASSTRLIGEGPLVPSGYPCAVLVVLEWTGMVS